MKKNDGLIFLLLNLIIGKKTLKAMKATFYIFLVSITQAFAIGGYSQVMRLSIDLKDAQIKDVLNEIEAKSEFYFMYDGTKVDLTQRVNIDVKDQLIDEILNSILVENGISYSINNRQIALNRADANNNLPQTGKITGKVVDAKTNEPVIGANIFVEGTQTGTVTDAEGNFTMDEPKNGSVLVISFIGFTTNKIIYSEKNKNFVIQLESSVQSLDDVVVVGYGTQKRRDVIGSVVKVEGVKMVEKSTGSLEESLQGLATGLQVTSTTGAPGGQTQIRIRGINSISLNVSPLWVVDGVPGGAILNPRDIESIEVLKDAAATSIYGSRASAGVIMVTTKSGKAGKKTFDIDLNAGITSLTKYNVGYGDNMDFLNIMDAAWNNTNNTTGQKWEPSNVGYPGSDNNKAPMNRALAESTNSDWYKELTRNNSMGNYQEANLSTSSNTENTNMYFSVNYRNDKGVFKSNEMDKLSVRYNFSYSPLKRLKIGFRTGLVYSDNKALDGQTWYEYMNAVPYRPIYDENDGTGLWNPKSYNVVKRTRRDLLVNDNNGFSSTGTLTASYEIPKIDGLKLNGYAGYYYGANRYVYWNSALISTRGASYGDEGKSMSYGYTYNFNLTYDKTFGDHKVSGIIGTERQSSYNHFTQVSGYNTPGTYPEVGSLSKNDVAVAASFINNEEYISGYLARLSYKFKDRYLLEGSLRNDGSSKFQSDVRWHNFYSFAAGWIISDENFFNIDAINLLKLRGSTGTTGNSNVNATASYTNRIAYAAMYNQSGATGVTGIGNSTITWETTNNNDIGLDFGLFNNRLNGSVAYYYRNISGLLLQVPLPPSTGVSGGNNNIWQNVGDMKNMGWEFSLNALAISKPDFTWEISLNYTNNSNEVTNLHPQVDTRGSGILASGGYEGYTLTKKGMPLGVYYLPYNSGVNSQFGYPELWELDKKHYAETGETLLTGKTIPATTKNASENRVIHEGKTGLPTYYGGVSNNFTYKNFDLSFLFTFSGGNYILNMERNSYPYDGSGGNIISEIYDNSWKKPGDVAEYGQLRMYHRYTYTGTDGKEVTEDFWRYAQSRNLEKGDYLRLKSLIFGYNLPITALNKIGLNGLRIYFSGTNLLTFTKFKGYDPELPYGNITGSYAQGSLPALEVYSLGLSVKF